MRARVHAIAHALAPTLSLGLLATTLLTALATTGCASLPTAEDAPPAFAAGPLRAAVRAVQREDLVREPDTAATYLVIEGDRKGTELLQRVERDGDTLILRETARADAQSDKNAAKPSEDMRMTVAGDGTIILHEVTTHTERSASVFADGLPFAGQVLSPGATLEGKSPMRVYTLPARKPRGKGSASRSLRLAGESTVSIGRDRFEASVVDLVFDVELDVAKAHVTSRLFIVPGRGVVAEQRTEELRVLGIFPRTTVEHTVLTRIERTP